MFAPDRALCPAQPCRDATQLTRLAADPRRRLANLAVPVRHQRSPLLLWCRRQRHDGMERFLRSPGAAGWTIIRKVWSEARLRGNICAHCGESGGRVADGKPGGQRVLRRRHPGADPTLRARLLGQGGAGVPTARTPSRAKPVAATNTPRSCRTIPPSSVRFPWPQYRPLRRARSSPGELYSAALTMAFSSTDPVQHHVLVRQPPTPGGRNASSALISRSGL